MVNLSKLVNEKVTHIMYGTGIITETTDKYLVVTFQENIQKKFTYPDCFDSFLKLEKEKLCIEVEKDLAERKTEKEFSYKKDFNACLDKMHAIDKRVKKKQEAWLQTQREKLERQRLYSKQRVRTGH